MSKQLEEYKAKVAEHLKKHPQQVSGIDLETVAKETVTTVEQPTTIEALVDDIEDTVEELQADEDE